MIPLLLEVCEAILKEKGYKCTPKRLEILSYFLKQRNQLISAKRLTQHLYRTLGNISTDTVYRNLSLFSDLGMMEFTYSDGECLYYLKSDEQPPQHLFICKKCLSAKEISISPMPLIDPSLEGCTVHHHKFEVYGLCPSCL
jgi:Fur family zinc uptake transcriptional regulator